MKITLPCLEKSPYLETLSKSLGLELEVSENGEGLVYLEERLSYQSSHGLLFFDWPSQWNYHRRQNYALSKEPLYKALGIKKESSKKVWDLTCGTGKDTLLMLFFGAHIVAFERQPIIQSLLQDSLLRLKNEVGEVELRLCFSVPEEATFEEPDVIYYDPMYPKPLKKKSALPRKEMQIFHSLVGEDQDQAEVFAWAKTKAKERVIVKRPLRGEFIAGESPHHSYTGKSTRYDMYITS